MWWFFLYWGVLGALAALEMFIPDRDLPAGRENRWPANFAIGFANAILVPLVPVSVVVVASRAQDREFGLLNYIHPPAWIGAGVTFVALSLAGYGIHVLLHKVPALWRLHRVHHMDLHLDVSTALRTHPLEMLITVVALSAATALLGAVLWAVACYELMDQIVALISHANVRLPRRLEKPLRLLLVTPRFHCLHHSSCRPETDSNYGSLFTLWDRFFGTLNVVPAAGYDGVRVGLDEVRDARTWNLWWQMISPAMRLDSAAAVTKTYAVADFDPPTR